MIKAIAGLSALAVGMLLGLLIFHDLTVPPECNVQYTFYNAEDIVVYQEMGQYTYSTQGTTVTLYLCDGTTKVYSLGPGWTMERVKREEE